MPEVLLALDNERLLAPVVQWIGRRPPKAEIEGSNPSRSVPVCRKTYMEQLEKPIELTLTHWANHAKEWVALLTGPDEKYGFTREFCRTLQRNWSRSGKSGNTIFLLEYAGWYEVSDPDVGKYGRDARKFIHVSSDSEITEVSLRDVQIGLGIPSPETKKVTL